MLRFCSAKIQPVSTFRRHLKTQFFQSTFFYFLADRPPMRPNSFKISALQKSCTYLLYVFVLTLLRQQTFAYISLASLSQSRPVHEISRNKLQFLHTVYTDYRTGHLSRKQYLQRVSDRVCPGEISYTPSHNVDYLNRFLSQIAVIISQICFRFVFLRVLLQ